MSRTRHATDSQARRRSSSDRRLERYAELLDSSVRLPGGYRIGLDGLIGLVPGIGDVVGALLSSYIIGEAVRARVPGWVLARMMLNVAIETVVGAIPVLGDVFDFVFKANLRNVALLRDYGANPGKARRSGRAVVLGWAVAALALAIVVVYLVVLLLQAVLARLQ